MSEDCQNAKKASGFITLWSILIARYHDLAGVADLRGMGDWYPGWYSFDFFRYDHDGAWLSRPGVE